jgi:hypothetical protein
VCMYVCEPCNIIFSTVRVDGISTQLSQAKVYLSFSPGCGEWLDMQTRIDTCRPNVCIYLFYAQN